MGEDARRAGFKLMAELRAAGVACDMDHAASSFKAQFKYADKLNAKKVIVIGGDELAAKKAQVKDMSEGTQSEVPFEDIVRILGK